MEAVRNVLTEEAREAATDVFKAEETEAETEIPTKTVTEIGRTF